MWLLFKLPISLSVIHYTCNEICDYHFEYQPPFQSSAHYPTHSHTYTHREMQTTTHWRSFLNDEFTVLFRKTEESKAFVYVYLCVRDHLSDSVLNIKNQHQRHLFGLNAKLLGTAGISIFVQLRINANGFAHMMVMETVPSSIYYYLFHKKKILSSVDFKKPSANLPVSICYYTAIIFMSLFPTTNSFFFN